MTFPTTSVLDNFNRSNEGPPPSASWSTPSFSAGVKVASNQAVGNGANSAAIYNTVYGGSQEVYAQLATKPADGNAAALFIQAQDVGSLLTLDCYELLITSVAGAGNDTIQLIYISNTVQTQVGSTITQEVASGDWFGLRRVGTSIEIWYGTAVNSMSLLATRTDSNLSGNGQVGLSFSTTSGAWDDLGGGLIVYGLTASNITTGAPSIATPTLGQTHVLTSSAITAGSPTVATPTIGQTHILSSSSIVTGSPSIGTPTLVMVHALTSQDIVAGAPSLGTPSIAQTHVLTATGVTTGNPALDTPTLFCVYILSASDITTGQPSIATPTLGQTHVLTSSDILAGVPVIGNPSMGGEDNLEASDIVAGNPTIANPAIGQTHVLTSSVIVTGSPSVGVPTIGQTHVLVSNDVIMGLPVVGAPSIGQTHILTASNITTGIPSVGSPSSITDWLGYVETDIYSERIAIVYSETIDTIQSENVNI